MDDLAAAQEGVTVRRFFVRKENISGGQATVTGSEFDHMVKVMRARPGDPVNLFDDQGGEHEGIVHSCDTRSVSVTIVRSRRPERESPVRITLAQALGKGDKMDWIVEKAVELGAWSIAPFISEHTVPRLSAEKAARRRARWENIALSAAKQCGRTRIPPIDELTSFSHLVSERPPADLRLVFWESESSCAVQQLKIERDQVGSLLLVVGPEGGFSEGEIALALRHGFRTVHMGKRILRTETAALAALTIAQLLWGDLGTW